jgi:chemotaxis methyl-accepting protein methylase
MKSGAKLENVFRHEQTAIRRPCQRTQQDGFKKRKVSSAGCSTGEQPYTLSIFLLEEKEKPLKDCTFEIQATGLNVE